MGTVLAVLYTQLKRPPTCWCCRRGRKGHSRRGRKGHSMILELPERRKKGQSMMLVSRCFSKLELPEDTGPMLHCRIRNN